MHHTPSFVRLAVCTALAALFTPALRADQAKPAPPRDVDQLIDVLFTAPAVEQATLAPDGRHLAFICEVNDHKVAGMYDLQKHSEKLAGLDNQADVDWIRWVGNDQLLLGLDGIYTSNVALDDVRALPLPNREIRWELQSWRPQDPDHVLLRSYPHSDLFCDLHAVVLSARRVNVLENDTGHVGGWAVDEAGQVRLAITPEHNLFNSYQARENSKAPWHAEPLPNSADPLFFTSDGQSVLISYENGFGRRIVQTYDLQQHKLSGDPLVTDPFCDVEGDVLRDNQTGTPIGLRYESEKPQVHWFNPQYQKIHALLQRSFPGQIVDLRGTMPDNRLLFSVYSDATPPAIYVLDLAHPGISLLLEDMPAAAKYAWAPTQPITFAVRDGYEVHGYLTLPLHHKAGQPVPLIAFSHGGPQARDNWGFEPEVQYFAALGYAVLQVNYRGSSGYGARHRLKDTLEVCEKSVDDVVDGINWAIKYGYADPKKIVVYGGSYGGYISLAIATRYPDLPAAAVGFAGVYDWEEQYKYDKTESYEKLVFLQSQTDYYIDPKVAGERYRSFSPAHFADKVRCPVLLMHGGEDHVVDIAQSKLMASALRSAGKSVEVIKDAEAIHGLPREKERRNYYKKLADFLLKNVPPDPAS